ncbi:MAG TPA: xanthine dehydrogenase family protein subunit M [Dehalococcoidia bacterium]|nr:xanthine dehydrogenase family protein subunit M [Dehalococcoidia bacterium]
MVIFYRRLPSFNYLHPGTLREALRMLSEYGGKARILAGGTDIFPKVKRREAKVPGYLVDLKGIPNLNYIKHNRRGLKIGALTTISDIETSLLVKSSYAVLHQAVSSMASIQIRNKGTLAGNICNAVPSADCAPALLVLEAKLKLVKHGSAREVPVSSFFKGPNKTVMTREEILTEIRIPLPPDNCRAIYIKLSPRHSMDLAVVGVAVLIDYIEGKIKKARIALGAVSPTPMRAKKAEKFLQGCELTLDIIAEAAKIASAETRPIDDHRASAEYRREMVAVLLRRAISQLTSN